MSETKTFKLNKQKLTI